MTCVYFSLRICDEQEVKYNVAGAQLHSGHLLLS